MKSQHLSIDKIENKIKTLQNHMINNGQSKGLSDPETIKYSQELDVYLNKYQQIKSLKNIQ